MTTQAGPFRVEWKGSPYLLKFNRQGKQVESAYLYRITSGDLAEIQTLEKPVDDPALFWAALKEALAQLRQLRFIQ
jgi:hypothetical protein